MVNKCQIDLEIPQKGSSVWSCEIGLDFQLVEAGKGSSEGFQIGCVMSAIEVTHSFALIGVK